MAHPINNQIMCHSGKRIVISVLKGVPTNLKITTLGIIVYTY